MIYCLCLLEKSSPRQRKRNLDHILFSYTHLLSFIFYFYNFTQYAKKYSYRSDSAPHHRNSTYRIQHPRRFWCDILDISTMTRRAQWHIYRHFTLGHGIDRSVDCPPESHGFIQNEDGCPSKLIWRHTGRAHCAHDRVPDSDGSTERAVSRTRKCDATDRWRKNDVRRNDVRTWWT